MTHAELAARVARLEVENRWMKRLGALALVAFGALLLTAAVRGGPKVLEGEKLVLKDGKGRPRLVFEVDADEGYAHLDLLDVKGKPQARLGMQEDIEPHMSFYQPETREEIFRMGVKPNTYQKYAYIEMTGEAKSGVALAAAGQNGPQLLMKNLKGDDVLTLGVPCDEPGRDLLHALLAGGKAKPVHVQYTADGKLTFDRYGGKRLLTIPPSK